MVGVRSYNHVFINSRAKKVRKKRKSKSGQDDDYVPNSGKTSPKKRRSPKHKPELEPTNRTVPKLVIKRSSIENGEFMCKSQSSDSECSLSGYSGPCWSGIPWQVLHKIFSIAIEDLGALPFLCRFVYWHIQ